MRIFHHRVTPADFFQRLDNHGYIRFGNIRNKIPVNKRALAFAVIACISPIDKRKSAIRQITANQLSLIFNNGAIARLTHPQLLFLQFKLFTRQAAFAAQLRIRHFPFDGRQETRQITFQDIIVRPGFHGFHCGLFTNLSGYDDERGVSSTLFQHLQSIQSAEMR